MALGSVGKRGRLPTLLLGLNGFAVYLIAQGYRYVLVVLLLFAAIGLSFLMERVLPYEKIWNQAHDDAGKDVAHGIVYEIANLRSIELIKMKTKRVMRLAIS